MTKLPKLEAEPTNDTAALTCYALDWRERAIRAESINEELLAALELLDTAYDESVEYPVFWITKRELSRRWKVARAAIAKAKGE